MKHFSKQFAFSLVITGLLISASAGQAFSQSQKPVRVRFETETDLGRAIGNYLDAAAAKDAFDAEMNALSPLARIENAEKIEIIAPLVPTNVKARPEQLSLDNERWAEPTCESLFKIAAGANLDLIGNEERAKLMYSKKEWKVLAPCLVELRKKARAKR